jgi:hypothetical protein
LPKHAVFSAFFPTFVSNNKYNNLYMKITKVNTMVGEFKSPVSTELSAVVERMQAPKTKEIADRIASIALQSRLMVENGGPR